MNVKKKGGHLISQCGSSRGQIFTLPLILLFVFGGAAGVGYTVKYNQSRNKLAKYYLLLKRLKNIYRNEKDMASAQESPVALFEESYFDEE